MPTIKGQGEGDEEDFELLEVSQGFLDRMMRDLTKASVAKQIGVGGASGCFAGYVFGKVGKAAAGAIGGSLLIMQVAHHKGYIDINWGKMNNQWKKSQKKLAENTQNVLPRITEEVKEFVSQNLILASSFAGGFLVGLAL